MTKPAATSGAPLETVKFHMAGGSAPVNVLDALYSTQHWRIFNAEFGVALPSTWLGDVKYMREQVSVTSDMVFCSMPGELHTTPRVTHPGAFSVLLFEPHVFLGYLREYGLSGGAWRRSFTHASPALLREMTNVLSIARGSASNMQAQSAIVDLFEVMLPELYEGKSRGSQANVGDRAVRRIRECLHADVSGTIDLETLAAHCGLSKFQALRAFKRQYGLPPHAYQLCLKVSMARRMLQSGYSATEVAASCGFTDQSHFGRIFKRALGVTPAVYGNAQALGSAPPAARWPMNIDAVLGPLHAHAALTRADSRHSSSF